MVLNSGKYRNYVTIKVATRTSDGQGGYTTVFSTDRYEWMKATPLSMSKTLEQGGIKYQKAVEFTCRYNDDEPVTVADMIVWNDENYKIFSVLPDEKNEYIKILAYV